MTLPLAGIKIVDFSEHGFVPSAPPRSPTGAPTS